jgi:hypothetical protein
VLTAIVARFVRGLFSLLVIVPIAVLLAGQIAMTGGQPGAWLLGQPHSSLDFAVRGPAQRLDDAAGAFEQASTGPGVSFQVVSRSTLHSKPNGPLIEIPDPFDRHKTLGYDTTYYVGGSIAEGTASEKGYWLQMRRGPASATDAADFAGSEVTLAALVLGGKSWRNDGEGWYETHELPGIGLDPTTVALLPSLLRQAKDAKVTGDEVVAGVPAAVVSAAGEVKNAPGLMAVDAAPFTELSAPVTFALDDSGRLVELRATMRNTNIDVFDLLVDTVITFDYATPPPLPDPLPAYAPTAEEK